MAETERVALVCDECGARNYKKKRPRKKPAEPGRPPERLAFKKHCPQCNRHTIHRESK